MSPARAATPGSLVIGQVIDLSGPNGAIGRDYVAGLRTFFDMANKSGGVAGKKVELVVLDDKGDAKAAAQAAAQLIQQERVQFLFGGVGEETTRAITGSAAFQNSGLTLYAPLGVAVSSPRVALWRPRHELELAFLLNHFQKIGITSVALAVQQSKLQQDMLGRALSMLKQNKMQHKGSWTLASDHGELAKQARHIASVAPGVVIVLGDTLEIGMFLKAYRQHSPAGFIAGTSLVSLPTLHEVAGARNLEWTVFSQVVPDAGSAKSRLQKEHADMMERFRDEPVSSLTLEGYAAAKTLAAAIEKKMVTQHQGVQSIRIAPAIDLGGLVVKNAAPEDGLSSWFDMALLGKNGRLRF
ncbi:ABC transporter substrate-binding protein [Lacisediminimonas profundi]|uniref:ABC transporter substrate-binding protein n=1 Tax=Lacisediminimonas profundi TaxID=2603856 RepID=UPI0013873362|nr:ABC transporter substrate-binding protein [Lacisediminimonas profundi]